MQEEEDEREEDNSNMSAVESTCGSINGSSVEVPEVIIVDTGANNKTEDKEEIGNTKM